MKLPRIPRRLQTRRRWGGLIEGDHVRYSVGALHSPIARGADTLRGAEFRAFSQFGEDGIIQWLITRVPIAEDIFVELGCGDYRESNTRFLLEHDNWQGLAIDADAAHLAYLHNSGLAWRHSIEARQAFVTQRNVNDLFASLPSDIGLLSIDLDGVDYWILEALTVTSPRIIVAEYNSIFGREHAVTVPYMEDFSRPAAHWSWLYFGASLPALCTLLEARGYRFVGSNSVGSNAFWVRADVAGQLRARSPADEWVESRFRDARNRQGGLAYVGSHRERLKLIEEMPLVDVVTGTKLSVGDLLLTRS